MKCLRPLFPSYLVPSLVYASNDYTSYFTASMPYQIWLNDDTHRSHQLNEWVIRIHRLMVFFSFHFPSFLFVWFEYLGRALLWFDTLWFSVIKPQLVCLTLNLFFNWIEIIKRILFFVSNCGVIFPHLQDHLHFTEPGIFFKKMQYGCLILND